MKKSIVVAAISLLIFNQVFADSDSSVHRGYDGYYLVYGTAIGLCEPMDELAELDAVKKAEEYCVNMKLGSDKFRLGYRSFDLLHSRTGSCWSGSAFAAAGLLRFSCVAKEGGEK